MCTKSQYRARYKEITTILSRNGFGWLLAELHLRGFLPWRERLDRQTNADTQAIRLRHTLEELGPTFIKLGQILSTRSDLLPPHYIQELEKLQDDAPPVPLEQITAVFLNELGQSPQEIFAEFDPEPLATASIGQVHAACLPDGTDVVVKIQRPGVTHTINCDLQILADMAQKVARYTQFGQTHDVEGMAQEFAFTLRCELNYTREGQNTDHFRQMFAGDPDIHVPEVYWEYSAERVIVMERLRGRKINDLEALDEAGLDRREIAAKNVRLMLEQIFAHGFFHADPHPGNVYVLADGRIGLLDYGMVGRLDDEMQASLTRLFMALGQGDSERMLDELIQSGMAHSSVNRAALKRDLDHMIICYADKSVSDLSATRLFNELTDLARSHNMTLPSELVMMARTMSISEGVSLTLDPDFQFVPFTRPYLQEYWLKKRSPLEINKKVLLGMMEMAEFSLTLPRRITRLTAQLERGELGVKIDVRDLDQTMSQMQKMVNRLTIAILISALVIGLSQFSHMAPTEGIVQEYAGLFFEIAFILAALMGVWLIFKAIFAKD